VSLKSNPFQINEFRKVLSKPKTAPGIIYEGKEIKYKDKVAHLAEYVLVDNEAFVKSFMAFYSILKDLSSPAIKVLCYIGENIKGNKDEIKLPYKEVAEYCGYKSKKAFYQGVNELLLKEVIIKKKVGVYYINPNVFFRGDRKKLKTDE
jgi:hypothetical protein